MNRENISKKNLRKSALLLMVSVVLLIGTTFAWFTDTASTGVNTIQAGNLDIGLEYAIAWDDDGTPTDWADAEGQTLEFKKANNVYEPVLWEPGCTYVLPELRVVNKGNLALKYGIEITGIDGDAKLNEVIDWTIGNQPINFAEQKLRADQTGDPFQIQGHMQENAGNEYQGLTIDGIGITVRAVQDTVESDSFNNEYDTDATYLNTDADGNYLINNVDELLYFAKSVNVDKNQYHGKTIILTSDIDLAGRTWIPIGTQPNPFNGTFDGQGHTIKNMTVNNNDTSGNCVSGFFGQVWATGTVKNVKFDNANVTGNHNVGVVVGYIYGTVEGCTITNSTIAGNNANDDANGDKVGGVAGYFGNGKMINNTVTGCTINAYRDAGGITGAVGNDGTTEFTGNKVNGTTITYEEERTYASAGVFTSGRTGYVPDDSNTYSNVTINKKQ